jgi:phospholipid-binding lipoprotein MlaA
MERRCCVAGFSSDSFMSKFVFGKLASVAGLVGLLFLAGCATPPPADDPDAIAEFEQLNDPLEPMNRAIFDFDDWLDRNALKPAALAYRAVTPHFVRDRIADALANLKSPVVFLNDLAQGNATRGGVTLLRFVLNSTFGVAGLMDVATPMGLPGHVADVGETFAVWGAGEGFYLVLPLFGPSNPRDALGLGLESTLDPLSYYLADNRMRWVSTIRFLTSGLSQREAYIETLDDIKRTSLDYYSAMRSLYRQRRDAQIKDAETGNWAPADSHNKR